MHDLWNVGTDELPDYLAVRLEGTDASWHNLEKAAKDLPAMWNDTIGRFGIRRLAATAEFKQNGKRVTIKHPHDMVVAVADTGAYEVGRVLVSKGYTTQDWDKVYETIARLNEVYPCDFIAVMNRGFTVTATHNIGFFETADKARHFSRFAQIFVADKSEADKANLSCVRIVCKNTKAAAERDGVSLKFRHSRTIDQDVNAALSPMLNSQLAAARAAQQYYIDFYNDLLVLPEPNRDSFYNAVFGIADPDSPRAIAQRNTKIERFEDCIKATLIESPELLNTAALLFNAATRSQQNIRTRGRDAKSVGAAMAVSGQNTETVNLATAFFENAIRNATIALPAPVM